MNRRHYFIALLALILALPALSSASTLLTAKVDTILLAKSDGITLEQAAARVRSQTGGRILSADEIRHDGRKVYRIKVLLPSGHVRVITVNANGG
ncbi:MAG: PepSY domain-containing protein [Acidiferrobacterales bacterium]